ncbi:hypothetical protein BGZ76_008571 [Entomortierella beljakovae]|nr:hypothetical protein BGZ76_008571 [Entomortierella beljakovae]
MAGNMFDVLDDKYPIRTPDDVEIGALFLSLACITIMSLLFGRKTSSTTIASLNYPRALVVALYVVSWLFSIMASMLAQTNNDNFTSCSLSIFVCIILYAISKILIYLFLVERVHIVSSIGVQRWHSPMFRFNVLILTPYAAIFGLAVGYRVATIVPDGDEMGHCKIGLRSESSVPLIIYDVLLSCWLTFLFLKALLSSTSQLQGPSKTKLRNVARKTLAGTILSLIFSTGNIASIVAYAGHERGVLCLALCTLDVTLNALTIHWVTSRGTNVGNRERPPTISTDAISKPSHENRRTVMDSHISVSIESYVEEYHQMHIVNKAPTSPSRLAYSGGFHE